MASKHNLGLWIVGGLLGLGTLSWASGASAKASGLPAVLTMLNQLGFKQLPIAVPSMEMIEPVDSATGPRAIEWVRQAQARGKAVLVPSGYFEGQSNPSPKQIVATDVATANAMVPWGVFRLLPKI